MPYYDILSSGSDTYYFLKMNWCVYILECSDGSLYTGITNNLEKRMQEHEKGAGAKYTRGKAPFTVIYKEECLDRSEASRREAGIKRLSHKEKTDLSRPGNN